MRSAVLAVAAVLSLVACVPGKQAASPKPVASPRTLHVLGSWTGADQASFLAMLKPFEDRTGLTISYEGTGDLDAILEARVQSGQAPDLAGIPGPGVLARYAKSGTLKALNRVLDMTDFHAQYGQPWLDLASVDGRLYGIVLRAQLSGQIWYDPRTASSYGLTDRTAPATWEQLVSLSNRIKAGGRTPWCMGLQATGGSSWPGTDWVGDILLRQAGPQKYQDWYSGKLKWTSPEVKLAWQAWGRIAADPKMVYGGRAGAVTTNAQVAGNPLFSKPPGCYLQYQAGSLERADANLKPVQDYDFFPFPDIDARYAGTEQVSADLFGMVKSSPEAGALLSYLASPAAQAIWVARGGALSPNREVADSVYPDALARQADRVLTGAREVEVAPAASMPPKMTESLSQALRAYVEDPATLDAQLAGLDRIQADAYR
jgi:alpha-glucoside transport system substrate-binding protein